MFVGVGFFALITGAIAQRFLAVEVDELGATERELILTEAASRDEVVRELRELAARLQRLEQAVRRL
jgi:hypothetical protein